MDVGTCMCAYMNGPEATPVVIPQALPFFIERGSFAELRAPSALLTQHWDFKCIPPCLAFEHGHWRSNSDSHAYTASTLSTEPFPQPLNYYHIQTQASIIVYIAQISELPLFIWLE